MSSSPHHRHNLSSPFPNFGSTTSDRDTAAAQQEALAQDPTEATLSSDVKRNKSDSSASSSMSSKRVSMQQKLAMKNEKKEPNRSASMPTAPLKSAMKAPRTSLDRIPNNDPLPEDKEKLTGHLNHTTSQLQQLADRAERLNEWIDIDTIVLQRLKEHASHTPTSPYSYTIPTPKSTNFNIPQLAPTINVDPHVTAQIIELQERIAVVKGWLKELERSVYWQREEYRRTEKAMGRKKSGQSGSVSSSTNKAVSYGSEVAGQGEGGSAYAGVSGLGFAGQGAFAGGPSGYGDQAGFAGQSGFSGGPSGYGEGSAYGGGPSGFAGGLGSFGGPGGFGGASGLSSGQSGLGGGSGLFDGLEYTGDVDEDALYAQLAAMEASMQAEGQGESNVLMQKDYARERWSSGKQSRLPNQSEWEEMFGKGALKK